LKIINANPKEFLEILEIYKRFIESADDTLNKTLALESLISLTQNNFFLL
jgi:hypothetical protein